MGQSNIKQVKVMGYPVPIETLRHIWENIRSKLVEDFPVAHSVEMPPVQAFVVPRHEYKRVFKQLVRSTINTSQIEWGENITQGGTSACAFISGEGWVILKRERYGYSLEVDLEHELTHVWEHIIGLEWGQLTKENH